METVKFRDEALAQQNFNLIFLLNLNVKTSLNLNVKTKP